MLEKDNDIAKAIRELRESAAALQESLTMRVAEEKRAQEEDGLRRREQEAEESTYGKGATAASARESASIKGAAVERGAFGRIRKNSSPLARQQENRVNAANELDKEQERKSQEMYDHFEDFAAFVDDAADQANETLYYNLLDLHNHGLKEMDRAVSAVRAENKAYFQELTKMEEEAKRAKEEFLAEESRLKIEELESKLEIAETKLAEAEQKLAGAEAIAQQEAEAGAQREAQAEMRLSIMDELKAAEARAVAERKQALQMLEEATKQLQETSGQMQAGNEAFKQSFDSRVKNMEDSVKVLEAQMDHVATKRGLARLANSNLLAIVFSGVNLAALIALILMMMGIIPS